MPKSNKQRYWALWRKQIKKRNHKPKLRPYRKRVLAEVADSDSDDV